MLQKYFIYFIGFLCLLFNCCLQDNLINDLANKAEGLDIQNLFSSELGSSDLNKGQNREFSTNARARRKKRYAKYRKYKKKKYYERPTYDMLRNYPDYIPPMAYSHGVFKVRNQEYYSWVEWERDYMPSNNNGSVEVADPLEGLSPEEKSSRLLYVCEQDKYFAPFRNPRAIQYLRRRYYAYLARSRNSTELREDQILLVSKLLKNSVGKLDHMGDDELMYYKQLQHMHPFIGMMERTPRLDEETLFPRYLPVNMPPDLIEFYDKHVALSREDCIEAYRYNNDRQMKYKVMNPRRLRVTGESCYELSTYCDNSNPNWPEKLNRLFRKKLVNSRYSVFSGTMDICALNVFRKMTGCTPHLSGMAVNPNAPYIAINADAITYCRGEPYLLQIMAPNLARTDSLRSVMKSLMFLNHTNGKYSIKKRHQLYGKLQLGLGVLRLQKCFLGLYGKLNEEMKLLVVRFDNEFFKSMINNVYRVYFSKLLPRFYYISTRQIV